VRIGPIRPFKAERPKGLERPSRALLCSCHKMNEVSEAMVRWLEQKRRKDRVSAAVISALALGSGVAVFLLMAFLIYAALITVCGAFFQSVLWPGFVALGLTAGFFLRSMKGRRDDLDLRLDPMGFWILKDIGSVGPRLLLEGLRNLRRCGQLGELNVAVCARALAYLAGKNAAVTVQDLAQHCPDLAWPRLREQLSLLDGVLFFGEDAERVTLMDPFRVRLRSMLGREPWSGKRGEPVRPKPKPEPAPQVMPVNEPEKLSAYEILGLSPSASMGEIKTAYRKRVKECHPDLFAGMDQQARDLAERWTKALNAAYSSLKTPQRGRH
jgi:hypothetical protein